MTALPGNDARRETLANRETAEQWVSRMHEKGVRGLTDEDVFEREEALTRQLAAAEAAVVTLREVLTRMAAFDDEGANAWLAKHRSFGRFDEPCAVQLSRSALTPTVPGSTDALRAMLTKAAHAGRWVTGLDEAAIAARILGEHRAAPNTGGGNEDRP